MGLNETHKWVGGGAEERRFCAVQEQCLVHLTMDPRPVFLRQKGAFVLITLIKTPLVELPLEGCDKRCDI